MSIHPEKLLGARVLITDNKSRNWNGTVDERRVLEFSPSLQWVRLMDQHGRKYWGKTTDLQVVEVLTLAPTESRPNGDANVNA